MKAHAVKTLATKAGNKGTINIHAQEGQALTTSLSGIAVTLHLFEATSFQYCNSDWNCPIVGLVMPQRVVVPSQSHLCPATAASLCIRSGCLAQLLCLHCRRAAYMLIPLVPI